jgi:hypothetical protein
MMSGRVIHDLIGLPGLVRVSPGTDMRGRSREFRCRGMNGLSQALAQEDSSRGVILLVGAPPRFTALVRHRPLQRLTELSVRSLSIAA